MTDSEESVDGLGVLTGASRWESRGATLYDRSGEVAPTHALSPAEAEAIVSRRLALDLRTLGPSQQDEAIAAATRGYLAAHRARGLAVVESASEPLSDPKERLLVGLLAARGTTRSRPAKHRGAKPPAEGGVTLVTFEIADRSALMKGLVAGKVRVRFDEDPLAAVARRIARDTHCELLAVTVERREPAPSGGGALLYGRIELLGRLGPGLHTPVEGEIRVVIRDRRPS